MPADIDYKKAYRSAKFKSAILIAISRLFYPWINDLSVRVYSHFKDPQEFKFVLMKALEARAQGKNHIDVPVPTQPKAPAQPEDPKNVHRLENYKRKPKKDKSKK